MTVPAVCALMVTKPERVEMAKEAIADFARQDWPHKLLIVVGQPPVKELSEFVQNECEVLDGTEYSLHSYDDEHATLGVLRNQTVKLAASESLLGVPLEPAHSLCLQWDDDDRYHPSYISSRMAGISGALAGSCLSSQLYYFTYTRQLFWVDWYNRRPLRQAVLIPGTVLVRTDLALTAPYPETGPAARRSEDDVFLQQLIAQYPASFNQEPDRASEHGEFYLRRCHGQNTWSYDRFHHNARWLGRTADEMRRAKSALIEAFRTGRYVTPGTVHVMGRDVPAFDFEVDG